MKIIHCCLSCYYIDDYGYQENSLVRQNVNAGHDVTVIASTESLDENGKLVYLDAGEYMGGDGAKVVRLDYLKIPNVLARKLRINPGLMSLLESEQPDVILFHGLCGWELVTVARYKKQNSSVKLYADSHEDLYNSGTTFISKYFLHLMYYRSIIQYALMHLDKVLCITKETMDFCKDMYSIPNNKIEFYPLGGHVLSDIDYNYIRQEMRESHEVSETDVLFVQSGKFDQRKKLKESICAFKMTTNMSFKFLIIGSLSGDGKSELLSLIASDPRIQFLGWKNSEELQHYLSAADIYLQPGTQSATMQNSVCARCAVILDDVESHRFLLGDDAWYVKNQSDIVDLLTIIENDSSLIKMQSKLSFEIAKKYLDYKMLAKRLEV